MIKIVNLTPHPVTIIRSIQDPNGSPADRIETSTVYPACAPDQLPRAIERNIGHAGCMELSVSGDTQDAYENACTFQSLGTVDYLGFDGVENLPDLAPGEAAFGCETFRIVSIVTAIGALASGRPIVDLLIPCGQVRDASGRIIGATGLAPASSLLSPMAERLIGIGRKQRERPEPARVLDRTATLHLADALQSMATAAQGESAVSELGAFLATGDRWIEVRGRA